MLALERLKQLREGDLVYWDDPSNSNDTNETRIVDILTTNKRIFRDDNLVGISSGPGTYDVVPAYELKL